MNRHLLTQYGIRDLPPVREPQNEPDPTTLPSDHPCSNCQVLNMHSGVPYCFLPRCNRDIFKEKTDGDILAVAN